MMSLTVSHSPTFIRSVNKAYTAQIVLVKE